MDATAWGAIGGGLSALSEGLTAMQLRKLAKQREDEERERKKEEAALRKAQLKAQEFQSMDTRNFKKVSENGQVTNKANANALLNAAAFGRGGEQVKGDISGDTYFRAEGDSPNDQRRTIEDERLKNALEAIRIRTEAQRQIDEEKGKRDLYKWGNPSANNTQTNETRIKTTGMSVEGANTRAANRPTAAPKVAMPKDRTTTIMQYAKQLATPRFNRETMETEPGLPWEQAVEQAKVLVDKAAGVSTAAPTSANTRTEDEEAERARQTIAKIVADPSMSGTEKQAKIDQVDQLLQRNLERIRRGGM